MINVVLKPVTATGEFRTVLVFFLVVTLKCGCRTCAAEYSGDETGDGIIQTRGGVVREDRRGWMHYSHHTLHSMQWRSDYIQHLESY